MKPEKSLLATIVIFLILVACDSLDSTGSGVIYGNVYYGNNSPIENATVKVTGSRFGGYSVTTDSSGYYNIPGLPQGTYSVEMSKNDEKRSQVVELSTGSFSCDSPEQRVDFQLGGTNQTNLNMRDAFITPSTVSSSSDTSVIFGVLVDGAPDSVRVVIGSVMLGLNDNGSNGDSVKGDNIFSGNISSKSLTPGKYNCEFQSFKNGAKSVIYLNFEVT